MGSSDSNQKLGLTGLAALVFGMMVGSGIFNIPQNMAVGAGLGAVIIGWCVTALGMLMLVATFKILSDRHPELNEGIYQYAEVGFNRFVGFNVAWGYWLCACFANVAYAVMLSDTFGAFSRASRPWSADGGFFVGAYMGNVSSHQQRISCVVGDRYSGVCRKTLGDSLYYHTPGA